MSLFKWYLPRYLRNTDGVVEWECRGAELLRESINAGHGILLAPNHSRPSDPMVTGILTIEAKTLTYTLAGWHVFKQSRLQAFVARRLGGFSIYREGMDRPALNCAIDILASAERPLVIFPEGVISRTNDRLGVLMDGTAFIARAAARRRARENSNGKVVIHPIAIKYEFLGDMESTLGPALEAIERRLSWHPQHGRPLLERVYRLGSALVSLKEIEYFGETRPGVIYHRIQQLIDHLLQPLEEEWLQEKREGNVVARVKDLRVAILPDMVVGEISEEDRQRRWRQLADVYLAQQLSCYPRKYLRRDSPPERFLETVEGFEEYLTDRIPVHGNLKVHIRIGDAFEVSAKRERRSSGDPIMREIETRLHSMITELADEIHQRRNGRAT